MNFRTRRRGKRSNVLALIAVVVMAWVVALTTTGSALRAPKPHRATTADRGLPRIRVRPPTATPASLAQARAVNDVLSYTPFVALGTRRRRVLALTFDDGPSPYTPAILRILTRMQVPATFFVVGQQLHYFAAAVRVEVRRGFGVGDHTQNHAWLVRLGASAQFAQIHDAATAVQRIGAPFPALFRPPYGAYNRQTLMTLHKLRMLMVLWSIDPGDWRRPGTAAIVANVLARSRPGAIAILHDGGGDRSQTVAALPAIIRGLRRRGYTLVSVPQLLAIDAPPRHQRLPRLGGA